MTSNRQRCRRKQKARFAPERIVQQRQQLSSKAHATCKFARRQRQDAAHGPRSRPTPLTNANIRVTMVTGSFRGHPLATTVNRDNRIAAADPAFLPCPACLPGPRDHSALGSRSLVAPLRTSHPSGSRPARLAVRGPWLHRQPQKTLCSPPCPIHAAGRAGRTGLWLRSMAIQPLVAHGTGATNSDAWAGSARGVQSGLMVLPNP